jgi:hypothetical protein
MLNLSLKLVDLSCDEVVPSYAWEDNIEDGAEIYLRHQGEQHGLRYKFCQMNSGTGMRHVCFMVTAN